MSYNRSVGELKDSLGSLLVGVTLDNVTDLNGSLERSARAMAQYIKVPEASGKSNYMIFDGVTDYIPPDTIFGGSVTDFRPIGQPRTYLDDVYKMYVKDFDISKGYFYDGVHLTFDPNNGQPIMRVESARAVARIIIDGMNDTSGWTAGGNASNLAKDTTVYYNQPAALRFTLAAAGSAGYIERTLANTLDLTDYEGVGSVFLAVDSPSASAITSWSIRLGSSPTSYFTVTNTEGFTGPFVADDYQIIQFDLANAIETGNVDIENVDYARITANYDGTAMTNVRVGAFFTSLPIPYQLTNASAAIFNKDGVLSNAITNDNTLIVLGDAGYTPYQYQCALDILLQNGGSIATGLAQNYSDKLFNPKDGLYTLFRMDNPSNEIRTVGSYE